MLLGILYTFSQVVILTKPSAESSASMKTSNSSCFFPSVVLQIKSHQMHMIVSEMGHCSSISSGFSCHLLGTSYYTDMISGLIGYGVEPSQCSHQHRVLPYFLIYAISTAVAQSLASLQLFSHENYKGTPSVYHYFCMWARSSLVPRPLFARGGRIEVWA